MTVNQPIQWKENLRLVGLQLLHVFLLFIVSFFDQGGRLCCVEGCHRYFITLSGKWKTSTTDGDAANNEMMGGGRRKSISKRILKPALQRSKIQRKWKKWKFKCRFRGTLDKIRAHHRFGGWGHRRLSPREKRAEHFSRFYTHKIAWWWCGWHDTSDNNHAADTACRNGWWSTIERSIDIGAALFSREEYRNQ